jgi:ParB family transcriptional regulator, chromosome partitioning protein
MKQLELIDECNGSSGYDALSSVWEGTDAVLLERIFGFYPSIDPEPILDATHNAGRFWIGSKRNVWSMDIDPTHKPRILADNRTMVGLNTRTGKEDYRVPSNTFGTVVFDPPHVGPQGRDKSIKRFDADYGAHVACGKEHGWTLSYLYPPFLEQAKRVLKPEGLLLAKITDMVNSHRSRWAHCDFMRMAEEAGFTVCDLIVKIRKGPMQSNRWKTAHHARKRHCFWIICRNGPNCERQIHLSNT